MRGHHALFIIKDLRKAICTSSRLKNLFIKNASEVNGKLYKRERNKCVSVRETNFL